MTDLTVDQVIESLRSVLRAEGLPDDDSMCPRLAALKLMAEQKTGFHHNGAAHTTREKT